MENLLSMHTMEKCLKIRPRGFLHVHYLLALHKKKNAKREKD
ncbi:unnamed protein product [Phytomonas sp. EM1]|nr:unnamed protein product [Phytomonas sp. EM1]|eukprot:CCW60918.1 unnamed protein product [Phytomonas sp. isolate EM1]